MTYTKDSVLPVTYDENTMVMLAQNPETIFVYWELSKQLRDALTSCGDMYLRLHRLEDLLGGGTQDVLEAEVIPPPYTKNWYFNNLKPGKAYFCELGCKMGDNFFSIITSHFVNSPSDLPGGIELELIVAKGQPEGKEKVTLVIEGVEETPLSTGTITVKQVYKTMPFYTGLYRPDNLAE